MKSDSGVVIRMWGGLRTILARSLAGVSPVRPPLECAAGGRLDQAVDGPQEGSQCLAGTRRRRDQRICAGRDVRPSGRLWVGGGAEGGAEPAGDEGMKQVYHAILIEGIST